VRQSFERDVGASASRSGKELAQLKPTWLAYRICARTMGVVECIMVYRSASNNDLVQQSTRLKLGESAFSVAAFCHASAIDYPLNSKLPRILLF